MENGLIGLMEMFIVLAFVLGWGILELVSLRLDKKRAAEQHRVDLQDQETRRS